MTAGLAHDLANSVQTLTSAGNILKAHDLVANTADLRPTLAGAAVALRHVETMVTALLAFVRSQPDDHSAFDPAQRSEEHTSELQSLIRISYAVFCLKKKTNSLTRKYGSQR